MPRIWAGNFDFETTLAGENASGELQRHCAELTFAFLPIAEAGDVIALPGLSESLPAFDQGFLDALRRELGLPEITFRGLSDLACRGAEWELVPWGWTAAMQSLARRHGFRAMSPSIDVVRRVHSRDYSFELNEEFGVQLDEAQRAHSLEELIHIISRQPADRRWVIKSNWGASARGQFRRRGNRLSDQDARWAASLLRRDGVLFWEPWLDSAGEAGIQFEIGQTGPPRLVAVVPMLTDRHGQYSGSVVPFANDAQLAEEWSEAVALGYRVCERMQSAGYFGSVGIDAMRYRDETGKIRVRPIQEINARWTMGRLAAAWRRYLPPASSAQWLIQAVADEGKFRHRIRTSPDVLYGQPMSLRMELCWMC